MENRQTSTLELAKQFRELQTQLRDRWQGVDAFDGGDNDIVVIPSLTLDQEELKSVAGVNHYEERHLFSLIRLRNPRTRLIYITSEPLHPMVIDYYLQLLPGIPFSHARDRLILFSTYDSSAKSLTEKILDRPRLIERIKQVLRTNKSYIVCFNGTPFERELSVKLGIPLYATDPDLFYWGTKSGSREIFAEAGVPFPDGSPLVWTVENLAIEGAKLWQRQPNLKQIVIKLNEGFSGKGNALLDLTPIQNVESSQRANAIAAQFSSLRFQARGENWGHFSHRIPELGAIAEAFIEGEEKRSPSVQGRIVPSGEVEILSTHDQILGGPDGQVFLGCTFPADAAYRLPLQEIGLKIGKILAKKGALERFGVDCIAVHKGNNEWAIDAIEINLRKGGTTHPFMALKLLTKGTYKYEDGLFYSQQGTPKYYVASDNLQKENYHGLLPNDLMDIIADNHLHFDTSTETGTIFHLMGCLSEFGKVGLTSIGNSPQQAQDIYHKVVHTLDQECDRALINYLD